MDTRSVMTTAGSSLTSLSKQAVKRARLIDLNEWIHCYLCGGYLIDATTLIDCSTLHFFCRSCLLKYVRRFELSNTRPFCPVCETPLNESKPHSSMRLDKNLQDIVYKLVPGLYKNEMKRRKAFYSKDVSGNLSDSGMGSSVCSSSQSSPGSVCSSKSQVSSPEDRGESRAGDWTTFYVPTDKISLSLEYAPPSPATSLSSSSSSSSSLPADQQANESGSKSSSSGTPVSSDRKKQCSAAAATASQSDEWEKVPRRKYLLCQAGMPASLLKKLIVQQYALDSRYTVQLLYNNAVLTDDLTLMDVIYIYSWRASEPMRFFYRLVQNAGRERKALSLKHKCPEDHVTSIHAAAGAPSQLLHPTPINGNKKPKMSQTPASSYSLSSSSCLTSNSSSGPKPNSSAGLVPSSRLQPNSASSPANSSNSLSSSSQSLSFASKSKTTSSAASVSSSSSRPVKMTTATPNSSAAAPKLVTKGAAAAGSIKCSSNSSGGSSHQAINSAVNSSSRPFTPKSSAITSSSSPSSLSSHGSRMGIGGASSNRKPVTPSAGPGVNAARVRAACSSSSSSSASSCKAGSAKQKDYEKQHKKHKKQDKKEKHHHHHQHYGAHHALGTHHQSSGSAGPFCSSSSSSPPAVSPSSTHSPSLQQQHTNPVSSPAKEKKEKITFNFHSAVTSRGITIVRETASTCSLPRVPRPQPTAASPTSSTSSPPAPSSEAPTGAAASSESTAATLITSSSTVAPASFQVSAPRAPPSALTSNSSASSSAAAPTTTLVTSSCRSPLSSPTASSSTSPFLPSAAAEPPAARSDPPLSRTSTPSASCARVSSSGSPSSTTPASSEGSTTTAATTTAATPVKPGSAYEAAVLALPDNKSSRSHVPCRPAPLPASSLFAKSCPPPTTYSGWPLERGPWRPVSFPPPVPPVHVPTCGPSKQPPPAHQTLSLRSVLPPPSLPPHRPPVSPPASAPITSSSQAVSSGSSSTSGHAGNNSTNVSGSSCATSASSRCNSIGGNGNSGMSSSNGNSGSGLVSKMKPLVTKSSASVTTSSSKSLSAVLDRLVAKDKEGRGHQLQLFHPDTTTSATPRLQPAVVDQEKRGIEAVSKSNQ